MSDLDYVLMDGESRYTDPEDTYEPTPQEQQWLNMVQAGFIGYEKPRVTHEKFVSNEIPISKARIEDGDNAPEDPEQADLEDLKGDDNES